MRPTPTPVRPGHRDVLGVPLLLALVAAAIAWVLGGHLAAAALVTLAAYEIALSVDNAVPMAGVAGRLHPRTRAVFLTAGLFVGVVVMRLLVPPLAVATAGGEELADTTADIVTDPTSYAADLAAIRPELAGFGGVFLWMVFSEFLVNAERKDRPLWIAPLERPFYRLRRPRLVQFSMAAVLAAAAAAVAADHRDVALAGAAGIAGYALVKLGARHVLTHALAVVAERALAVFLLLEVLDGAYSFSDSGTGLPAWERLAIGVAGVSIGAVFLVRLTRRLDAVEALKRYEHLPAGAAYALGALGALLWLSLLTPVPAPVAAWFGAVVIGAALVSSLVRNHRRGRPLRGADLPAQRHGGSRSASRRR
ncbi:DUF475 domain-containing protein [Kineococcus sp. SYSU DK002]|uniref:DUF475 domain-containing protein n=1 Tax=Kineococcus sp. SYSU DK002 TaxID=3383123 RepID=UPI003D7CE256